MLGILAIVVLGFTSSYGASQTTPKATCLGGFDWSFNTLGQSPCDIAASLAGVCFGGYFTVEPLEPGKVYLGPQLAADANPCRCSSVYYSLLGACALCQDRAVIGWSAYKANCSAVYDQVSIPSGVRVPHYAYLDVQRGDTFNATLAQATVGPESTSVPSSTGGSPTPSGISFTPAKAGAIKIPNHEALVRGVIGGLVALAVIVL